MKKLILLLLLLFMVQPLFARYGHGQMERDPFMGGRHGGPHHRRPWFGDEDLMRDQLGLSEKQVQAIISINRKMRERLFALGEQIRPLKRELHRLLSKENVSMQDARRQLEKISKLEIEIRILRIEHRLQIAKILTKEQRQKLRREWRRDGPHD